MEDKRQISDELLAKFMSGLATPEEEDVVLAYLSESEENLDDFKNMSDAVMANHFIASENNRKRAKVIQYIGVAAAVALVAIVSLYMVQHYGNANERFVQRPQNPQTTDNPVTSSDTSASKQGKYDEQTQKDLREQIPVKVEPRCYADSSHKTHYANMVYPSKKRTSISMNKKNVNFRWNTDAVEIHLSVKSNDGKWMTDQQFSNEKYYTLSMPDNVDTLLWQVVFTYADGTSSEQNGMIMRWDTGLKLND